MGPKSKTEETTQMPYSHFGAMTGGFDPANLDAELDAVMSGVPGAVGYESLADSDSALLPAIFGALPPSVAKQIAPVVRQARQDVQVKQLQAQIANLTRALSGRGTMVPAGQVPGVRAGANILGGFGSPSAIQTNLQPTSVGGTLVPIESGTVAAGGTALLQIQPQMLFRGERFQYTGPANTFLITDFRIMNIPQFATAGSVSADSFSPLAVLSPLNFTECWPSGIIAIGILNTSGAGAVFRASFFGSGARQ